MTRHTAVGAAVVVGFITLSGFAQNAQSQARVFPTRPPSAMGAPVFMLAGIPLRGASGVNPPADVDGDFLVGPDYVRAPEYTPVTGEAKGAICDIVMKSENSKFYPGITKVPPGGPADFVPAVMSNVQTYPKPYERKVTVYVPAKNVPGTPTPVIVTQDGPEIGLPDVLDNLIAQRRVPAMIAVMLQNGGGDAQGSQRGLEYDTMSGRYAEFVEAEVLPLVEKTCNVTITRNPDARAAMGRSSGGVAAFTMAWFHPELYRRVVTWSGTYVMQESPTNPDLPHGAWEYHERLIPQSARKPIRLWMQVGDRDLLNPNTLRDGMHDGVEANHRMAHVLKARGYHYQYVFSLNAGHSDRTAREQLMPEALEWLWKDYQPARN
jgi:enterochelin esterase family protein